MGAMFIAIGVGFCVGLLCFSAGERKAPPMSMPVVIGIFIALYMGPTLTSIILGPVGMCIGLCIGGAVCSAEAERKKEAKREAKRKEKEAIRSRRAAKPDSTCQNVG